MNEEVFGYSELYRGNHDRGWIRNDGEGRKRYSAAVIHGTKTNICVGDSVVRKTDSILYLPKTSRTCELLVDHFVTNSCVIGDATGRAYTGMH